MKKLITTTLVMLFLALTSYAQQIITNVKMTNEGIIYQLDNGLVTSYECNNENQGRLKIYSGNVLKKGDTVLLTEVDFGFFESKKCLCISEKVINKPENLLMTYLLYALVSLLLVGICVISFLYFNEI